MQKGCNTALIDFRKPNCQLNVTCLQHDPIRSNMIQQSNSQLHMASAHVDDRSTKIRRLRRGADNLQVWTPWRSTPSTFRVEYSKRSNNKQELVTANIGKKEQIWEKAENL